MSSGQNPYSSNPGTQFPGSGGQYQQPGVPLPNYLVQSILVTLCCCLPFGIAAIVNAAQVNAKIAAGDHAGAKASSDKAKKWCWIGVISGVVINVLFYVFFFIVGMMNDQQQNGMNGF